MATKHSRLLEIALGGPKKMPKPALPPMDDDYEDSDEEYSDEDQGDEDDGDMADADDVTDGQVRCAHDVIAAVQSGDAHALAEAVLALVHETQDDEDAGSLK